MSKQKMVPFIAGLLLVASSIVFAAPSQTAAPQAGAAEQAKPQAPAAPRPLKVDDQFALKDVYDPQLSPDGAWVAYTVTTTDLAKDKSDTDIWMAPLAGGEPVRVTTSPKGESRPRFSPDGKWLAFLSAREGKFSQVWLLPRSGGEAFKLTDYKSSVSDLAWSPDGKRLALIVRDVDPEGGADAGDEEDAEPAAAAGDKPKSPKPIVIDRLQFKRDGSGYLRELRRHLYVFDVEKKTGFQLTSGPFDDSSPAWSPEGARLAFTSNRLLPDPDRTENGDVFVIDAAAGSVPRAVVSGPEDDGAPAWSPDGKSIAYVQGCDPKDFWYGASHLAVVPADGGTPKPLTAALDRNVYAPRFSPDGRAVYFLLEDGGNVPLCRVGLEGGAPEKVVAGEREVQAFDVAAGGAVAVLESSAYQPAEISRVGADGALVRLSHVNDAVLKTIKLGEVRRFKATSPDGTQVDAFLILPPDYKTGTKLPAILRIHGGPVAQYSTAFEFERQLLAAAGYAVIACNPRGSSGYGTAFSRAIWADWGTKDSQDVLAAVDAVVSMGIADPDRLGVGGWSYGGILTDYVVTKTQRFKAAISGASAANILAGYGTDHYQWGYEVELGLPWRTRDVWLNVSSSFFNVENITTPILYMCGQLDMNVPLLNSEQLYQAVRRIGKAPTELVIYPDQWHGIETPSLRKDRDERYLAWYGRYLKPGEVPAGGPKAEATSLLGRPLYAASPDAEAKKKLDEDLAKATAEFLKNPDSAANIVWLGRRTAYLGRFREAIDIYTRGIAKFPRDAALLRHRGHRYISVREFDKAVKDLARAAALLQGRPDQPEPSSVAGGAAGSLRFNVWYHLGLAHFLKGDFMEAYKAYRECLLASKGNDENLAAATDWAVLTLRRLGNIAEAKRLLEPITAGMKVAENRAYLNRLLMYKGAYSPEELLRAGGGAVDLATYGFAVGQEYLLRGEKDKARLVFERVTAGTSWPAFGYIASEAELARMK